MSETNIPTPKSSGNQTQKTEIKSPVNSNLFTNKKVLFFFGIIILILIITVSVLAGKNSQVSSLKSQAQEAYNSGDYKTTIAKLTKASQIKKGDPTILAPLIQAYSAEGNISGGESESLQASQAYITEALQTDSQNVDSLIAIGYAYETAGQYDTALTYYQKATNVAPASSEAWFHLGHVLEFLGILNQANSDFNKALSLDPNNPQALMEKGNMLLSNNDLQGSYQAFLQASKEKGIDAQTQADALTAASVVRRMQNNFEFMSDSLALSQQAVKTDPSFSPALSNYGLNLILTGDPADGANYLKKSIAANPKISGNYNILAQHYLVTKDFPDAISYYKQAVSAVDNDNTIPSPGAKIISKSSYEYSLAKTYDLSGQSNQVLPLLKSAVQLNPQIDQELKYDFSHGVFTDFGSNQDFVFLMPK